MSAIAAKVSGIFIPVTDVRRSAAWYARIFRMEIIELNDEFAGLKFPHGEALVGLWRVEKPQPVHFETGSGRLPYFNFESFDIERSHRELKALGVKVTEINKDIDSIRFFDCFDPDGHELSIVEELDHSPYYAHKQRYKNGNRE